MRSQGDGELVQHRKTDQNKEDVDEDEDDEYGVRRSVKNLDPREPSIEAREEHEKTHLPCRNWCRHCVRGRGKEEACRDAKRDQEVAEVHLDFMFMGDEGDDRTLAVLVVKERSRGMVMSTVAPRKSSGQWLGRRVMAFMREAGCEVEAVVIKSDNERVDEGCGGDRKAEGCDRRPGDGGGKQPCALEQEQRIHREDDPERAGAGEDVEE